MSEGGGSDTAGARCRIRCSKRDTRVDSGVSRRWHEKGGRAGGGFVESDCVSSPDQAWANYSQGTMCVQLS